jgi:hypothetical protein
MPKIRLVTGPDDLDNNAGQADGTSIEDFTEPLAGASLGSRSLLGRLACAPTGPAQQGETGRLGRDIAQGQRIHQLRQPSDTATNGAHHGHIDHGQRPARPPVPAQVVHGTV